MESFIFLCESVKEKDNGSLDSRERNYDVPHRRHRVPLRDPRFIRENFLNIFPRLFRSVFLLSPALSKPQASVF
jgi:hypothetical protein